MTPAGETIGDGDESGVNSAAGSGLAGFWGCVRRMANAASSLPPTMPSSTSAPSSPSTTTAALSSPTTSSPNSVAICFLVVLGFRALFCLLSMLQSSGYRSGAGHVVVRRDWSLGGKEVVIARRMESLKALSSPLSAAAKEGVLGGSVNERVTLRKKRLPKWWRIWSKMNILFLYQWWTSRITRETPID